MAGAAEATVVVGVITKPHGLRGEVVVLNRSDNPDRWAPGSVVFLEGERRLTVRTARSQGASRLLVAFEELPDRDAVEGVRGELLVPVTSLPELPEGEYWPHQLEGCEVMSVTGRSFGWVTDVIANPANDIWVAVDDRGAETLIPAIRDVVAEVDVGAKRIVVHEVPGLTAPD
jgi:16S rRNA processing protein RimM